MSENIKNEEVNEQKVEIPKYDIKAPKLDDTNYANELSNVFNNINSNFIQLANRDFVKGEQGTSVMIEEIDLSTETELRNALKACIEDNEDSANNTISYTDKNGTEYTLSLWDNFNNNPGTLKMIYTIDENNNKEYVSSLYYVFLDGRFANTHIGNIDHTEYTTINDLSCIVVYDKDGFKKLSNAFPTIYYERGVGLCWKLNGVGTGIPVQGIPGKNGENGKLYIVKSNETFSTDKSSVEVTHVYDNSYTEVDDFLQTADIEKSVKYPAIILCPNPYTTINGNLFYFGTIEVVKENDSKKIIAYSDYTNAINTYIDYENITNYFKNIDITNTNNLGLPGIFIPLESKNNNDEPQKAHLLSASSITNNSGENTLKSDIILTPVSDINSIIDADDNTKILVNKYLYIKVDETQLSLLSNNKDLKSELENLNYILKYKLNKVVKSKTPENFKYTNNDTYSNNASMFIDINGPIKEDNINFIYYDEENKKYNIITDHYLIMPEEFEEKLADNSEQKTGIYRWELCIKKDANFDPDEFKESEFFKNPDNSRYSSDGSLTSSSSLKSFNVIFTTTMSPTLNDSYMWFNGLTKKPISDFNIESSTTSTNNTQIFLGWDYTNSDLFKFLRFIPVYEQTFNIEDDTLLNINYNVNITGDYDNPKKNLTVNGGINCEDFKAYNIAAAGEIKNIYTKDEIIGDSGLKLSNINNEYVNIINSEGIKTNNINSDNIIFENILNKDNSVFVNSKSFNESTYEINYNDINFSNINNLSIEGSKNIYNFIKNKSNNDNITVDNVNDIIDKISNISANNSAIITNSNSPIIVSNTDIKSQQLCVSGIPENYYNNGKIHPANTFNLNNNKVEVSSKKSIFLDNLLETEESSNNQACYTCPICGYIYNPEEGDPDNGIAPDTEFDVLPNTYNCPICEHRIGEDWKQSNIEEQSTSDTSSNYSNFDKVKNFNIHRLSLTNLIEEKRTKTIYSKITNLLETVPASKYYSGRPELHSLKYGEWYQNYSGLNYNNSSKNYMHKFTINKQNDCTLNVNSNIEIDLSSIYNIIIGIYSRTRKSNNPKLSEFKLKLYCAYKNSSNDEWEELSEIKHTLENEISFTQDNCYKMDVYTHDDDINIYTISDKNNNESGSWRYKSFKFKGKKFNITVTKNMINSYNAGKLEFIIYPKFEAKISNTKTYALAKNNQVHAGFFVTMPIPILDNINTVNTNNIINADRYTGKYSSNNCKLTYNYIEQTDNSNIINSSTITDDGIIFRSDKYTFGLGYSKNFSTNNSSEPILFYHEYDYTKYTTDDNNVVYPRSELNTNESIYNSYAQRTQAIPLKDLFKAIDIIKEVHDDKWNS